jgi:peroxiredoxin
MSTRSLTCVLALFLSLSVTEGIWGTSVGDAVPAFSLTGLDGKVYKPEDFKGKVLVLFFIGHNCPVCVGEAPGVEQNVRQAYEEEDLQLLGLDMWNGSTAQLQSFQSTTRVTFPLLQMAGTGTDFGISTQPVVDAAMVVDQDGLIAHIGGFTIFKRAATLNAISNLLTPPAPLIRSNVTSLNFGSELQAGETKTLTFEIRNDGNSDLVISGIDTDLGVLTFSSTELTLEPGASARFDANLSPTQGGSLSGSLSILSNDEASGPLQIPIRDLTVISLPGAITIATTQIDFGDTEIRRAGTRTITIDNTGEGPLLISEISADISGLAIDQQTLEIAAGLSANVTVTVTPDSEGNFSGTITFKTNDPENETLTVSVTGTAIVIPADSRTDFNSDGQVNLADFIAFVRAFNSDDALYDLNENSRVDFSDFIIFVQSFGRPVQ